MTRQLLFPATALVTLVLSAAFSPVDPPECNDKYCTDPPGGEPGWCEPAVGGPHSICADDLGWMCEWGDFCRAT